MKNTAFLQRIISLLETFVSGDIDGAQFSIDYIKLRREIVDNQYKSAENYPDLKKIEQNLIHSRLRGELSQAEYVDKTHKLVPQLYRDASIMPFSPEDEIVGRLFTAAEGYENPGIPDPLDLPQLLEIAKQILDELRAR